MKNRDERRKLGLGMDTAANGSMLAVAVLVVVFAVVGDFREMVPAVQADQEVTSWLS